MWQNDRGHNEVLYLQETMAMVGGLFARQGYARRPLRGGRYGEVGGVMSEELICVTVIVRQGELSQDEMVRLYSVLCFGAIFCDRVLEIENKRFVSSRLVLSLAVPGSHLLCSLVTP